MNNVYVVFIYSLPSYPLYYLQWLKCQSTCLYRSASVQRIKGSLAIPQPWLTSKHWLVRVGPNMCLCRLSAFYIDCKIANVWMDLGKYNRNQSKLHLKSVNRKEKYVILLHWKIRTIYSDYDTHWVRKLFFAC